MKHILLRHLRAFVITAAAVGLVITSAATLSTATAAPRGPDGRFLQGEPKSTEREAPPGRSSRPITGVLNINTATAAQLTRLPGIGPSKAARIVEYRSKRGAFRRVRDLRRVKGIGRKTLERIERHLSVKGASTLR